MTPTRRSGAPFAVVLVAALALAACGEDRDDDELPQDVFGTTSTTPPAQDQVSKDAARAKVYEYVSGRNTVLSDPDHYRDTSSIGFAEGREATSVIAEASELRTTNRKLVGAAKLTRDPSPTKVDLDPPKKNGQVVFPFVQLTACIDESATHLVDASGKQVPKSTGKGPRPVQFHVLNRQYPDETSWRIAWHKELKGSC